MWKFVLQAVNLLTSTVWGVSFFALFLLCIAYPQRLICTRSRPDLPGPAGHPLVGNLLQILPHRERTVEWFQTIIAKYGPLVTFTMPPWGRVILINRPEWLEHIKQGMHMLRCCSVTSCADASGDYRRCAEVQQGSYCRRSLYRVPWSQHTCGVGRRRMASRS